MPAFCFHFNAIFFVRFSYILATFLRPFFMLIKKNKSLIGINARILTGNQQRYTLSYIWKFLTNYNKTNEKRKRNTQHRSFQSRSIFTNEFSRFMLWMHNYYWIKKLKRINYPLPLLTAFYDPFYLRASEKSSTLLEWKSFEILLFLWFFFLFLLFFTSSLCAVPRVWQIVFHRGSYFVSRTIVIIVVSGRFICATLDSTLLKLSKLIFFYIFSATTTTMTMTMTMTTTAKATANKNVESFE